MASPEVLEMPARWVQTCYACTNALFGDKGTFCSTFSEFIVSEKVAGQDCDAFAASDGQAYARWSA